MYEPQVNDYVKWTTALGMVHEGWVYFKCDYAPKKKGFPQTEHYITIELGVQNKPEEECKKSLHKKNHVLLLCYHHNWNELEYVTNRRNNIDVQIYDSEKDIGLTTSLCLPHSHIRENR